jgi:hypothetical protein
MTGVRRVVLPALVAIAFGFALLLARRAQAGGVVTNCANDTDLSAKLAGGGTITFSCGTATIILNSEKAITANTTIDGGGSIALSGGNTNRLFSVSSGVTLTLKNIVLTNGYAEADGGAIVNSGHLVLDHTTIQNSQTTSPWSGGAILTTGPLDITDSVLANNKAGNGGAIYPRFANAHVTISNSELHDNQTTNTSNGWGGAILVWDGATVTIDGSDLHNNAARNGGAIYNHLADSSITLSDTKLRDNQALQFVGGGIFNEGTASLARITVSGNTAISGGGIDNETGGTLMLTDSTLSGNHAISSWGGGFSNHGGTATVSNVTFSGNDATEGGGFANLNSGTATLTNVTMTANSSHEPDQGGGIFNDAQTSVRNVALAGNTNLNCNLFPTSPFQSSQFNLSTDGSCNFGAGRDNIPDMKLGPLADNGGPTLTQMPAADSPVVDAGTGTGCPPTDQRGAPRPAGAACDVGAVEFGSSLPTPTPSPSPTPSPTHSATATPTATPTGGAHHKQGDLDCNNVIDGRDALRPLRAAAGVPEDQPGGCPALDAGTPDFADVNCDGAIGPPDTIAIEQFAAGVAIQPTPPPGCTAIGQLLS